MSLTTTYTLLNEVDADTDGTATVIQASGDHILDVSAATWGSGTAALQLQSQAAAGAYVDLTTFTADGAKRVYLRGGDTVRGRLTGSTSPSNVTVMLRKAD